MKKDTHTLTLTTLLRDIDIFQGINEHDLKNITQKFQLRKYKARQHIFYESDPGLMMYFIKSGQIRIYINARNGSEVSARMLGAGQIFGELALVDKGLRSANVITVTDTQCYTLHYETFDALIEKYPVIARNTMNFLGRRIRETTRHVENLIVLDVMQRVVHTLINLSNKHGVQNENGHMCINFVFRDNHIASIVGASRESVNRVFRSLRDLGIIEKHVDHLVIVDFEKLNDFVGE